MKKKIIFRDQDIVAFCKATCDTNDIHDPVFMTKLGKRAIVPGMFAFSMAANLASSYLKHEGNTIRVFFSTLLSSGDFATLMAEPETDTDTPSIRISAINHKDTLTTNDEHTRIFHTDHPLPVQNHGILRRLQVADHQVKLFQTLIAADDPEVSGYLFTISYASQALFKSIREAETKVEHEIDELINRHRKISPFYQSLEITIPRPIPALILNHYLDYRISFERDKYHKAYYAYMQCEQNDTVFFRSKYRLIAISDGIILRMAKDITHHPAVHRA